MDIYRHPCRAANCSSIFVDAVARTMHETRVHRLAGTMTYEPGQMVTVLTPAGTFFTVGHIRWRVNAAGGPMWSVALVRGGYSTAGEDRLRIPTVQDLNTWLAA